jgi:predicted ATPase
VPISAVPATLHASLLGRLDRLGPSAKTVAQVSAAIGRDFSYELLAASVPLAEPELQQALRRLVEAGLVFQRGAPPTAEYLFKHALVRDAAYGTLLRGPRQLLHGRIADTLLAATPPTAPEIVAHHLQNAGRPTEAVDYWRQAGEQAVRRAANREAIVHFRRALALLEPQPETAERWRSELAILSQLAPALMSVHGWTTPEAGEAVERAAAVGRRLESSADLAPSIANLWLYNVAQARLDRANEISTDLFRIAGELDDPGVLLQAYHCAWPAAWHRGRFAQAGEQIEAGLRLYDEKRHAHHRNVYLGHDPAVCALGINASVQVALGFPARVSRLEAETIALARKLEHAPSLAVAFWFVCEARAAGGDAAAIFAPAQELLRMSEEGGLPQWRAHALIFLGWALALSGDAPDGIPKLHEAIDILSKIGHQVFLPRSLCLLAEALSVVGRHAEGLQAVGRALDVAADTGAMLFVARLHQTQGELLLHSGSSRETAEASLGNALAVAQQQGAKGYELRAATMLARLWAEQGRRRDARDLLAPVYGWFTEGFDTADLKDAKALLDELA